GLVSAVFAMVLAGPRLAGGTVRIDGVDYVDATVFGQHLGLRASWLEPEKRLLLQNATTRIEFEVNLRDIVFDGHRVWMGSPPIYRQHSVWISEIDKEKLLRPLAYRG